MTESVIPLAGIALPLFLVPTIIAMKMEGKKREMRHAERMRAMEMGLPIPGDTGWAAATAIAIGAGVPIGSFVATLIARVMTDASDSIFQAPALVSIVAVACGAGLCKRLIARGRVEEPEVVRAAGKPAFNPDAYDAVARRG